jgi:hypothetical protein
MDGSIDQTRFACTLPREISSAETDLVGGGFNWQAAAFVGALAFCEGGPAAAVVAGAIAGAVL